MLRRISTIGLLSLAVAAGAASAQRIAVSFNPQGDYDCGATIHGAMPVTWYLLAYLGNAVQSGVVGAEFRQDGTPSGWPMVATPSPLANFSEGDPLHGGCRIAFPTCQTGTNGVVLLYTVQGFSTGDVGCTTLRIVMHAAYSNPNFPCPVLVACDAPTYTYVCAAGGENYINVPCEGGCPVAVALAHWAQVKGLYK